MEHTDTVRTSQETHHVSATKPNRLMPFRETVAVYCENHTEHTDTLCGAECGVLTRKTRWYIQRPPGLKGFFFVNVFNNI
jgi:hypothetical protein